jgi:hypothetical protein
MGVGGVGMSGVLAADEPGAAFGALSLSGLGTSVRVVGLNSDGKEGMGQVPYSEATLSAGPYGRALSSVFWPGGTAGNGGTTLGLLGNPACSTASQVHPIPGCPPIPPPIADQYVLLNDPIKVETQNTSGDQTQTDNQLQGGVVMSATATDYDVHSDASVASSLVSGADTFGKSSSAARTRLTGVKAAVSDASSEVRDVSLGGGAIKIGSVKSTAHAVTDGVKSSGSATTAVSNFTIAGVPVRVDQDGIHVQETGTSTKAAVKAVNKVINNFMLHAFLTEPSHTTKGGATSYDSGSLIIGIDEPNYQKGANQEGNVFILGGARVTAAAAPGFDYVPPQTPPLPQTPAGTTPTTTTPGSATTGGVIPGGSAPVNGGPAAPAPVLPPVQLAGQPLDFWDGMSPWWSLLVLAGVGMALAGLKRLPDQILESTGTSCPLED